MSEEKKFGDWWGKEVKDKEAGRNLSMIEALREALREEMRRDPSVFLIGEDIEKGYGNGAFGVTRHLVDEFGRERVRSTPISEAAIVGAACGAAMAGMRPVAEIMFNDWITLAMEPIINIASKVSYMCGVPKCPVVIRTTCGAAGYSAATHCQNFESWFMKSPGLYVVEPSNPYEAKGLLKTSIREDYPIVFFEPKMLYPVKGIVPDEDYTIPLGKADIKREGDTVTAIGLGYSVTLALTAAEVLGKQGINLEVIDLRSLVPIDMDTIKQSIEKTNRVILVEEGSKTAGWAAELGSRIAEELFDNLDAPPTRVAALDTPIPYAPEMFHYVKPTVDQVVSAVKKQVT